MVSTSVQGVGMAVAGVGMAISEALVDLDGRSFRRQAVERFSIRQSQLGIADVCRLISRVILGRGIH